MIQFRDIKITIQLKTCKSLNFSACWSKREKIKTFSNQVEILSNFAETNFGLLRNFSKKNFWKRSLHSKDMSNFALKAWFLLKVKKRAKPSQMKSKYFETFQILTLDYLECVPTRIFEKGIFFQKIWQNTFCRQ